MKSISLRLSALAGFLLSMAVLAPPVQAVVQVTGNVWLSPDAGTETYGGLYADNPFTTTVNEGIPTNGNRIDPFRGLTNQIEFEGRPDTVNNTNVNFSIIVGRTSFGELIINQSQLRDMDLVIGDQAQVGAGGNFLRGSGVVRIEGFGALFNNDPAILPYLGVDPDTAVSPSTVPRDETIGYDLYVGRFGNGVLQLALGGRAEIQDAVIVGNGSGSVGTLNIDGIDSFLQSGGFESTTTDPDEVNYMVIGRLGSGTMNITNGGQSYNAGPVSNASQNNVFAGVVGSNLAADDANPPSAGGNGTVNVDGPSSKWTVAGNLQLGGFHDAEDGIVTGEKDLDGNDTIYGSGVGRGTLNVRNGALVSIVTPPLDEQGANAPNRLDLLVGRFGRINLDGGRIELLGAFNSTNPQNPTQEVANGRLINDGIVSGAGNISVLQFRNRVLGEVRVSASQKLLIDSTGTYAEPDNEPLPDEPEYPLSNYGLIEVVGTETALAEIEFRRTPGSPVPPAPTPANQIRPFLNLPLSGPPAPGNGRTGGEIIGQNSIMRFDSGIENRHKVSFIGGSNLVSGNFDNQGVVYVGGNGTTVTFVDQFFNNGILSIQPNVSLVTFIDDVTFGGSGSLNTTFGGRPSGQEISHLSSAEEIVLGGTLNASLFTSPGFPDFTPQPGDRFEIISSATSLVGNFADVNLPGCIGGDICFFGFPDYALNSYFIQTFSLMAAVGPDFNGDGVVDALDYFVWRQNYGTSGPAGDANNDGVVDAADYTIWRNATASVPGAGSGGLAGGTVPEPTSGLLLAIGSLLAVTARRRRQA